MLLLKKTAFIDEKEKRQPISNWLAWWFRRKKHIFRAFKRKNIPESNLAEAVYSAWVTQNRIQLPLCESEIDNICDMISIKQILKGYGKQSFGGGTGPSVQCLGKRKRARTDSILTKIMESNSSNVNAENECSPPRKKNKRKEREQITERKFM